MNRLHIRGISQIPRPRDAQHLVGAHTKKYTLIKLCGLFLGVLTIFLIVVYNALPFLLESFLQRFAERSGLGKFSGSVRRVSLTSLDLGSITLGEPNNPYAFVSSVTSDYSPLTLFKGKRDKILILSGAEINCSYDGKDIVFPGLDISKVIQESQTLQVPSNAIISVVEVKNSILNVNYCGKHLNIPFKLKYFPGEKWTNGHIELELAVREQILSAKLAFDETSTKGTAYIKSFQTEAFFDLFPKCDMPFDLFLSDTSFDFTITSKGIVGTAATSIQTPLLVNPETKVPIPIPLVFKYSADYSGNWKGHFESHPDSVMLKSERMVLLFKTPALLVDFCTDNKNGTSGEVFFNAPSVEASPFQATAKSLEISLPFRFPAASEPIKQGHFSISNISVKNTNIGAVSGELQQIGNSVSFSATAPSVALPNLVVNFNGECRVDKVFESDLFFNIPKYKIAKPINVGQWIPSASGMTYQGECEVEGMLKLSPSKIDSDLKLKVSNSSVVLRSKESTASASGISLNLEITDLFKLRSAPSQVLRIGRLSLGTIAVDDLIILLHIESSKAILIENIHAKWCDGNISVQALRIDPLVANYAPVISCDRVSFSKVLEQLNVGKAEGDGTLNGTIPITFKDGKIEFDNGFLYSTPGSSDKIKIEGGAIDSIAEGIPKDSPQFTQLILSQMALRNFDYEWVKLYLNTEGEDVVAKIQINGKPAKPLPFTYKKEYGGFVTMETSGQGSVFQGLNLDINIKLPFNKIMQYSKQAQKIIK